MLYESAEDYGAQRSDRKTTKRSAVSGGPLCALVALAIAACSRGHAAASSLEARRIVSLAPSTTEALFAIGAGDRVVGRSRFCDYPPQVAALPIVGSLEPDLEAVLELRPDLVVGVRGLSSTRLADNIAARGIPTWFADTESLEAVEQLLVGLGRRTGHESDATHLASSLEARAQTIERAVAGEPRPRVLMVVAITPVVAAGPNTFVDELLRRAGAINVLIEGSGWPRIGMERIVELDPDVVLDATIVGTDNAARIMPSTPGWSSVRAVREGHILLLRDERVMRAGPRVVDGLALLARSLHPGAAIAAPP
jgi:iron complex transport system substrate-binding protein